MLPTRYEMAASASDRAASQASGVFSVMTTTGAAALDVVGADGGTATSSRVGSGLAVARPIAIPPAVVASRSATIAAAISHHRRRSGRTWSGPAGSGWAGDRSIATGEGAGSPGSSHRDSRLDRRLVGSV